jgi:hypothetical protein
VRIIILVVSLTKFVTKKTESEKLKLRYNFFALDYLPK